MAGKKQKTELASVSDPIFRLMRLFPCNQRAHGEYDPRRERNWSEDGTLQREHWDKHLKGVMGCGSYPVQDDDSCQWGGIDFDNHGSDEDLPLRDVESFVRERGLPLVLCRSKSGGIHAYLFLDTPQPAAKIQAMLNRWRDQIKPVIPGLTAEPEVFPKQARLVVGKDGVRAIGNYMNMPYFEAEKTMRYCVHEGKKLGLIEFLDLAERYKVNGPQLRQATFGDHPEAPPCVQRMMLNGVAQGHRNEALYNTVIYLRRMDPDGYENRAHECNLTMFAKPLPRSEAMRTIGSASKPEMGYRCNQEPIKTLCDRDACLKRKFGITAADAERLATVESIPVFTDLVKYLSEPVRWELSCDGVRITNVSTPQLLDWRAVREIIADRLTKIVPMIKNQEWERILQPLMKEARIIEAPDDASVSGVIRARLREFAARTDLTNRGEDKEDRKALLRGLPVVQKYEGERMVFFRGEDFINYLKRTKSEELKGVNLWFAVKEVGVQHTKLRAGDNNINLWYLPVKQVLNDYMRPQAPEFKSDL